MSDTIYHPNPERGCGTKKPGGFYLEAGFADRSSGGILNAWTWMLGEGVEGGVNCAITIPPRRMVMGNAAATLTVGEFISADMPTSGIETVSGMREVYGSLITQVGDLALFDHVGSVHYSAYGFVREVETYGPSRRVPPLIAEEIVKQLPMMIVFTHSRAPLFRDEAQRDTAVALVCEFDGWTRTEDLYFGANWLREEWGVFASQQNGSDHYLIPILSMLDRIEKRKGLGLHEVLRKAEAFFADVPFVEQVIGASWITRVGYVPDGTEDPTATAVTRKGIQIIDLNAKPEVADV